MRDRKPWDSTQVRTGHDTGSVEERRFFRDRNSERETGKTRAQVRHFLKEEVTSNRVALFRYFSNEFVQSDPIFTDERGVEGPFLDKLSSPSIMFLKRGRNQKDRCTVIVLVRWVKTPPFAPQESEVKGSERDEKSQQR